MRGTLTMLGACALLGPYAYADGFPPGQPSASGPTPSASVGEAPSSGDLDDAAEKKWEFSVAVAGYIVPDGSAYLQPTFSADHDWLHLEARYNYEDIDTSSAWAGYNFSWGKDLTLDLTPMIGAVAGNTDGIAPGYEFTLTYGKIELYSEGEFLFDLDDSSDSFFYNWTELSFAPVDCFRFGLVIQRTKESDTGFDIDRGLLVGFTFESVDVTAYVFNLGWDDPMFVLSVGMQF